MAAALELRRALLSDLSKSAAAAAKIQEEEEPKLKLKHGEGESPTVAATNGIARPQYNNVAYWEDRYAKSSPGEVYEWVLGYDNLSLREKIDDFINSSFSQLTALNVLHPGCGDSTLGVALSASKSVRREVRVVNTDASATAIAKMSDRHPEAEWVVMDSLVCPPHDHCLAYDVVLDKCLLDAFTCGGTEFDKRKMVHGYLEHCANALKAGGRMLVISFGQPETRRRYFEKQTFANIQNDPWPWKDTLTMSKVRGIGQDQRSKEAFLYVLEKK